MFARSTKTRIGHSRPSFTLVELLISIAIIGVMAGMVLFTLAGAQQDSLRTRTRGTIDKINAVILERWEGYRYRSVKLPIPPEALQSRWSVIQQKQHRWISPFQVAKLRSLFLKDMMRMEMPDSYSDLAYTPTALTLPLTREDGVTFAQPFNSAPGREYNMLRNYFGIFPQINEGAAPSTLIDTNPAPLWSVPHQSAECLYAIVAHSTIGGGSALESFHASEIADTDGDGFPEFIDAWGQPIMWYRWPAGYTSALNASYKQTSPDAFDPLRTSEQWKQYKDGVVGQMPWTVVPLIVSSGSDKQFGLNPNENIFATLQNIFVNNTDDPTVGKIGSWAQASDQASDNVSNHDLLLE